MTKTRKTPKKGIIKRLLIKNNLENLSVYAQLQLNTKNTIPLKATETSLQHRMVQLRKQILSKIENSTLQNESKGLLQALLLAERNYLFFDTQLICPKLDLFQWISVERYTHKKKSFHKVFPRPQFF